MLSLRADALTRGTDNKLCKDIVPIITVRTFSCNVWPQFRIAYGHQLLISVPLLTLKLSMNDVNLRIFTRSFLTVYAFRPRYWCCISRLWICFLRLPVSFAMLLFTLFIFILLFDDTKFRFKKK